MSHRLRSFLLLTTLLVAACGSGVNRGDINVYSLEDEWRLGAELAREVDAQVEVVDDPVVQGYVDEIGQAVAGRTQVADREWNFTVIDDEAINAFALPGGHIYVHSGLLQAVGSEAELAGVLAHEVAHVEARHSTEMLTRAYGIEKLLGLLGDGEGELEQLATDLVRGATYAKFSRNAEREADSLGVAHLAASGYDPTGLAAFFETLLDAQARQPTAVEQFFSTHPLTDERRETVTGLAAGLEPEGEPAGASTSLPDVQARLD